MIAKIYRDSQFLDAEEMKLQAQQIDLFAFGEVAPAYMFSDGSVYADTVGAGEVVSSSPETYASAYEAAREAFQAHQVQFLKAAKEQERYDYINDLFF